MAKGNEEADWTAAFIARTKALRDATGMTQEEMAQVLKIPAERYRKYENRSPLPTYLIERFALIVGRDIAYVLTGKNNSKVQNPKPRIVAHK